MKLAIQGHPTKGKEVIQILESLGGKNIEKLTGTYKSFYYIDDENEITDEHKKNFPPTYKLYTLEEFEKEFPFKIGDIILLKGVNKPYEIIALEEYMNKLCYKLANGLHYASETLTTYEKMKKERNITLTLDKAKEWYNKGGELKEIALQAYSEEELTKIDLPKTWKEFCANYLIQNGEAIIDEQTSQIRRYNGIVARGVISDKNICPSQESAEAHLAMIQLEQLRNCWWNGWKPEWKYSAKYAIKWDNDDLIVFTARRIHAFLVFPTREMAEEFLECFRSLIEQAGDLI